MIAIPIFLLVWLGGGTAANSVSVGFHTAASVFLAWSYFWTAILFVVALFEGIKFRSFFFWGIVGTAAAYCLTLGGWFVGVGLGLWLISVIVEILTLLGLAKD